MENPFDISALQARQFQEASEQTECLSWCQRALTFFPQTALTLSTPLIQVPITLSVRYTATNMRPPWPEVRVGKQRIAQYYRVLVRSDIEYWVAADGGGISVAPDGQVFRAGRLSTVDEASLFIMGVVDWNLAQTQELFDAALRGEALAY